MISKFIIDKPRWLLNIHSFFEYTIKKSTLNIHMVNIKVLVIFIRKKNLNNLKSCRKSKGLIITNTFLLTITFNNKSCFIANNITFLIYIAFKISFNSNHRNTSWFRNQSPNCISIKLIHFSLHSSNLIWIFQCNLNNLSFDF